MELAKIELAGITEKRRMEAIGVREKKDIL